MESLITILVSTLNACTHFLVANVTSKLPSALRNLVYVLYGLHEGHIGNVHFWYPDSAKQMAPSEGVGLLECTVHVWAKYACRCSAADFFAFPTEPLPFRYERYAVALLVYSKIAAITENDGVRVFAVPVVTYRALAVRLISRWIRISIHSRLRT
jgi:hypothetical protein